MSLSHLNVSFDGKLVAKRAPFDYNTRRRFGRRLAALHAYLSKVPASQYNHRFLAGKVVKDQPCGAVACAFGHAVASGKFPNILAEMKASYNAKGIAFFEGHDPADTEYDKPADDSNIKFVTVKAGTLTKRLLDTLKSASSDLVAEYDNAHGPLKAAAIKDDMRFPADEYFGPGAWDVIFDIDSYGWNSGGITKAKVMKRIRDVAEKAYGVKVTA